MCRRVCVCVSASVHVDVCLRSVCWGGRGLEEAAFGGQDCWREGFGRRAWAEKSRGPSLPLGLDVLRVSVVVGCETAV